MKGSYVADLVTRKTEMELSIGDTIQVDDQFLTVVDIDGDEILLRIDSEDPQEPKKILAQDSAAHTRSCR
ncbi:hypothetical protein [uncultured Gimesia sp.]|uniref:hypothetical protein n=1 Tax=uncultured Gimesia sp. TaxID=1678688 RepID=UPI00263275A2|nr:hypothetical protein [uncultured Gimesia sp.]